MKQQIGVLTIDSGLCWIGDPSYIHTDGEELPKEWGKDWQSFLGRLDQNEDAVQFNHDLGHAGLGVCIWAPKGDGKYPVYGKFNHEGELTGIEIDFDPQK